MMKATRAKKTTGTAKGPSKSTKTPSTRATSARTAPARTPSAHKTEAAAPGSADWRAETLAHVRTLIMQTDPRIVEEVKWRKPSNGMKGVPVWSCGGIICTGETYKNAVKLTFAKGASLPDPARLFNASLEGNTRRAIDLHDGSTINEKAFKSLIRAAVAFNASA